MTDEVRLRIRGLMPEKLIERAREMGVRFQAIEPLGDHAILVGVSAADAVKLRALCERFSIPCEEVSRRGKSAVIRRIRRRWTLLVGVMVMLAVCWLFLGRIWRIDVSFLGDSSDLGDRDAILSVLEDMGIRPGIPSDIDMKLLSQELTARNPSLSAALMRVEGVRLLVEAVPEAPAPEVYDLDKPRHLYADRSGIVVSVNVEAGMPCVKPGDAVYRGQLLIRGEEQVAKEETRPIAALGEVIIRTWFEGSAEGELTEERYEPTGRASASSTLVTPWFSVPITQGETYASQTEQTDNLPVGGLYLPVRIERVTRRQTRQKRVKTDPGALEKRLSALAMAGARSRLTAEGPTQYDIARTWTRVQTIDNMLRVSAVCEINTNTAVPIEALQPGG